MIPRALDWLEERTGLPSSVAHFMNEEIPASADGIRFSAASPCFCSSWCRCLPASCWR